MTTEQIKASLVQSAKEMQVKVKEMYKNRLKDGWTLGQVDEMDIHFYFSLYNESSGKNFIDDIKLF